MDTYSYVVVLSMYIEGLGFKLERDQRGRIMYGYIQLCGGFIGFHKVYRDNAPVMGNQMEKSMET